MTDIARRETPDISTSALGCMRHPGLDAVFESVPIATALPATPTANTYTQGSVTTWVTIAPCAESTAAGPAGQIPFVFAPSESTSEAIMEIRRRSGLTWEELGDLFDVSRRSVHHWANGKPVNARHDRTLRRMLAAVRHLDQGDQSATRALLMTIDPMIGITTLDLLKEGRFDEVMGHFAGARAPELHRPSLSPAARHAHRPPSPLLLLEAEQERPDIPAKVRTVRARRIPKKAD